MTEPDELAHLRAEVARLRAELARVALPETAKESASRYLGSRAVPWIVLLVVIGVSAAAFLPGTTLTAVIGMVSTAVMALIAMLAGITGTRDTQDTPETTIIKKLIDQMEAARQDIVRQDDPFEVTVEGGVVRVSKGADKIQTGQ